MKMNKTLTVRTGAEWRSWLADHHNTETEVWVIYFKTTSKQHGIDYETSVEEALCFGWVDSIIQKIDGETYARKFNPRRAESNWSATNKKRVEKLVAEGRMTQAGIEKYRPDAPESSNEYALKIRRAEVQIPDEILLELQAYSAAWEHFQRLAPSHRRAHIGWIMSAKKAETRTKRLAEVVRVLEMGQELGMK